jgi:tetratricopeptide (TPR) repeat protein
MGSFLIAAFVIAPQLCLYNGMSCRIGKFDNADFLDVFLGGTRDVLSDYSLIRADLYYHGGIYRKHFEDHAITEDHEDDAEHRSKERSSVHEAEKREAKTHNPLIRLAREIRLDKHRHLQSDEDKEILPWIHYATRLNPNNIDAYVIGGYWIGQKMKDAKKGLLLLSEAAKHNPDSWKIYAQMGRLYLLELKDHKKALTNFVKAYKLFDEKNHDKIDRREICLYIGTCYENLRRYKEALPFYGEALSLLPEDTGMRKKIEYLTNKLEK